MTNASKLRASAIIDFSAGQDLVCDLRDQAIEVTRQIRNQTPQDGSCIAFSKNCGSCGKSLLAKPRCFQDGLRVERGSFNSQATDCFPRIGKLTKRPINPAIPKADTLRQHG